MSNVEQGVQQELAKLLDDFIAGLQQLRQRLAPSPPSPSAAEQKRYRILPEQAVFCISSVQLLKEKEERVQASASAAEALRKNHQAALQAPAAPLALHCSFI